MRPCRTKDPTFSVHVVGCKVNQVEAEGLRRRFVTAGWRPAEPGNAPDLVWVHTCTVTARADRDSRRWVQKLHREHPSARIVVSGCLAELEASVLRRQPGVAAVVRAGERDRAIEVIADMMGLAMKNPPSPPLVKGGKGGFSNANRLRARAFIKIEDGCDGACTYCRVRLARGPVVSRPWPEVRAELQDLIAAGVREIVLTGVNLGCWRPGLAALVEAACDLPGEFRLRLSSLEPQHLTPDLVRALALAGDRICPHVHLALQSGDDEVLRRMGRTYTSRDVRTRVDALRRGRPEFAITADVIVGFPGESEAAFVRTCELVQDLGCTRLHVFPFSPRPGTPAVDFSGQLSERVRTQRARHLRAFSADLGRRHRQTLLQRAETVLLENRRADGTWQGLTAGYERAWLRAEGRRGALVSGRVERVLGDHLWITA